jgi:molybdopterin/thiamine biosynthesis adenylyltransferase
MREAAALAGLGEAVVAPRFAHGRVLIRLGENVIDDANARETFLFSVNQIARFADNVAIAVPLAAAEVARDAQAVVRAIRGKGVTLDIVAQSAEADVTLLVGSEILHERPSVTVNSSGWVARMATSQSDVATLPSSPAPSNITGAAAATCLGASQVFHVLAGRTLASEPVELSLFERATGTLGSFAPGPPLPEVPLELDALLVGCGGVMHGFVYVLRRLPVVGRGRAVDRQRVRDENLGPYVNATEKTIGIEKAELVSELLAPNVAITPYPEDFDPLFTVRLKRGHFAMAPIVVAGLDRVPTRHTVQRLWPELLIDMGAAGETAQVLLKRRDEPGGCILDLLEAPTGEEADLARLAAESGLAPEVIRDEMDRPITEEDIAAAPPALRPALAEALRRGQLRCGFIRTRALEHERDDPDFAAAAPHVVSMAGVVAAAELVKELAGWNPPGSLRFQYSFLSNRGRAVTPTARGDCECGRISRRAA